MARRSKTSTVYFGIPRAGVPLMAEDVMAYIAAIMARPAFTACFSAYLDRPGLPVALTSNSVLVAQAVTLGRELVWLHC